MEILPLLISPFTVDHFFTYYFFKKPLITNSKRAETFSRLINSDDIDNLINTTTWTYPDLQIFKNNDYVDPDKYTYTLNYLKETLDRTIDVRKVIEYFFDTSSIVINSVERYWDQLCEFCTKLESELGYSVHSQIILIPYQGNIRVNMENDGFLVNIIGSGKYTINSNLEFDNRESYQEGEIKSADSIYLPKTWHYVYTSDTDISIQLLVYLHPPTWLDLFRLMISEFLQRQSDRIEYRYSIPVDQKHDNQKIVYIFDTLLNGIRESITIDSAKQIAIDDFLRSSIHYNKKRLLNIENAEEITPQSKIKRNEYVYYDYIEKDNEIVLKFLGKEVHFPLRAKISIVYMLSNNRFYVKDVKGLINGDGKLRIIRKLMKEGLLGIDEK